MVAFVFCFSELLRALEGGQILKHREMGLFILLFPRSWLWIYSLLCLENCVASSSYTDLLQGTNSNRNCLQQWVESGSHPLVFSYSAIVGGLFFFKKYFTFENTVIQPVLINTLKFALNIWLRHLLFFKWGSEMEDSKATHFYEGWHLPCGGCTWSDMTAPTQYS